MLTYLSSIWVIITCPIPLVICWSKTTTIVVFAESFAQFRSNFGVSIDFVQFQLKLAEILKLVEIIPMWIQERRKQCELTGYNFLKNPKQCVALNLLLEQTKGREEEVEEAIINPSSRLQLTCSNFCCSWYAWLLLIC